MAVKEVRRGGTEEEKLGAVPRKWNCGARGSVGVPPRGHQKRNTGHRAPEMEQQRP